MNVQHVSHVILQWNIMINPGISGSNCVGEKVRHLTTTLPQQVAADILNICTKNNEFDRLLQCETSCTFCKCFDECLLNFEV